MEEELIIKEETMEFSGNDSDDSEDDIPIVHYVERKYSSQNKLLQMPIVYTTRLDDMLPIKQNNRNSSIENIHKGIEKASKPKFKGIIKYGNILSTLDKKNSFVKVCSKIEKLNQRSRKKNKSQVDSHSALAKEILYGIFRDANKTSLPLSHSANAALQETQKKNDNETTFSPIMVKPEIQEKNDGDSTFITLSKSARVVLTKIQEKNNVNIRMENIRYVSIKQESDINETDLEIPVTQRTKQPRQPEKSCTTTKQSVDYRFFSGSREFCYWLIKNRKTRESDLYVTDKVGYITNFIRLKDIDNISDLYEFQPDRKRHEAYECCWLKREEIIRKWSKWITHKAIRFMKTKHTCLPGKCSCCCEHSQKCGHCKISVNNQLNTLDFEEKYYPFTARTKSKMLKKPQSNSLIKKALEYSEQKAKIPPALDLFDNNSNKTKTKIMQNDLIVFKNKPHITEYHELGEDGHINMIMQEDSRKENYSWIIEMAKSKAKELKKQNNVRVANICCWYNRESFMAHFALIGMLSNVSKFLREPHRCFNRIDNVCRCCCTTERKTRAPVLFNNTTGIPDPSDSHVNFVPDFPNVILNRGIINTADPQSPALSLSPLPTEISNPTTINPVVKNPILNNLLTNNSVTRNPLMNFPAISTLDDRTTAVSNNLVKKPAINISSVNKPTINIPSINKPDVNIPSVNKPAVNIPLANNMNISNPVINNQPNVGNQAPNKEVDMIINSVLERFKDVRLIINNDGKVSAELNTPISSLTEAELKVLAEILNHAQAHVQSIVNAKGATINNYVELHKLQNIGQASTSTQNHVTSKTIRSNRTINVDAAVSPRIDDNVINVVNSLNRVNDFFSIYSQVSSFKKQKYEQGLTAYIAFQTSKPPNETKQAFKTEQPKPPQKDPAISTTVWYRKPQNTNETINTDRHIDIKLENGGLFSGVEDSTVKTGPKDSLFEPLESYDLLNFGEPSGTANIEIIPDAAEDQEAFPGPSLTLDSKRTYYKRTYSNRASTSKASSNKRPRTTRKQIIETENLKLEVESEFCSDDEATDIQVFQHDESATDNDCILGV